MSRLLIALTLACSVGCSCSTNVTDTDGGGGGTGGGGGGTGGGSGACTAPANRSCGSDVGACTSGQQSCGSDGQWGACQGEVGPATESCNGLDDNCDGTVDEGCSCTTGATQACGMTVGTCRQGQQTCTGGMWGACQGEVGPATESCNGLDDNCNGTTDEGCSCTDGSTQMCGLSMGACLPGTQTCAGGSWGMCLGGTGPVAESCNGLDDDCDGMTDEGCDDDGDGYCDATMTVVGTPAVCPMSPAGQGNDCDDTAMAVHPGATESCNNADDNCAMGVDEGCDDDGDDYCDSSMTVVGTAAVCPLSAAGAGDDCNDTAVAVHPGATESCNDTDDNCAMGIDEGCDDDGDDYCDAAMTVVGTPAVCPLSAAGPGNDCDDTAMAVHPGVTEVCTDGIDNNCNQLIDGAEVATCPVISVRINKFMDPQQVAHGRSTVLNATISPADTTMAWTRTWAVVDAQPQARCAVGDVTLSGQTNTATTTAINALMPNVIGKLDCVYTVQVTVNGYARDTARVQMVNGRPTVSTITNATFDGTAWRAFVVAGSTPAFTVTAFDPNNDSPLSFNWTGTNASLLSCAPNCASTDATPQYQATATFLAAAMPGTYTLTVTVGDGFDPTPTSVNLIVEVDSCVWVRQGGAGSGATAATPLGTIAAALTAAQNAASTSVCIEGNGVFPENLTVPVSPNAPDIYGGYSLVGAVDNTQRPAIEVSQAQGLQFAAGYAGKLRHLAVRQVAGAPLGAAPAAVITVADASPELIDVQVTVGVGTPPIGVDVTDDSAVTAAALPRLTGSTVSSTATSGTDAIGIRTARSTGTPDVLLVASNVQLNSACPGACRGVLVDRARASITAGSTINVFASSGSAVGVDFAGVAGTSATGEVSSSSVGASAQNGPTSIAIRLADTSGVTIRNNTNVGMFGTAGRQFAAGIADGLVTRAGVVTNGNSTNLTVSGNTMIGAGASWWSTPCSSPGATGEGADVTAGIFLAGTRSSVVHDNGQSGTQFNGIFGGGTTIHWNPATRRLVPSAVGVWLVDTRAVRVLHNEIRAGNFDTKMGCPVPSENPASIAFRDGLPPNPAFGAMTGEKPSFDTVLDQNGVNCARMPENGGVGTGGLTWCVAAEVNAPLTSATGAAPVLTNNHLAATRGNYCIAYRQRGGSGVVAANNTFDADLVLEPFDPLPVPNTVFKWPLLLEKLDPMGLKLINNILYAHVDDPYDNVAERVVIREVTASGTTSHLGAVQNNLFFIQYDDVTKPLAPYVRVTDGTAKVDYDSSKLNLIAGAGVCSANFASPPGLTEPTVDWMKSTARLTAGSAAIDKGLPVGGGVPDHDIDGNTRPSGAGVDVGHDER